MKIPASLSKAPLFLSFALALAGCGGGDDAPADQPALNLGNPIHVTPGSQASTADGTEAHPFATVYDAIDAILADKDWDGKMILHAGRHEIPEGTVAKDGQVAIPPNADVEIEAGSEFAFGYKVGMQFQRKVEVLGTEDDPVLFTWLEVGDHWGSIANFEGSSTDNVFEYAIFEHGGEVNFDSIAMRGALSLRLAGGRVSHCIFRQNEGDDGANVRKSPTLLEYNTFDSNLGDALDSDQEADTEIAHNFFTDNTNDAIDMGEGCTAFIHHNVMFRSGDKGVSIGETSSPTIENNLFVGCAMGLGIKDGSLPTITNNTFYGNRVGIASYEAIAGYGSGKGTVKNSIFWNSLDADVVIVPVDPTIPDEDTPEAVLAEGLTTFSYSCVQSGSYRSKADVTMGMSFPLEGEGILSAEDGCEDPLFVNPDDTENPDFHLQSTAGHYDVESEGYVEDDADSPCIDAGDPDDEFDQEPDPNGGRIDLGTYGNHEEASHSP